MDPGTEPPAWPHLRHEHQLLKSECGAIAGLDEAGRGAWAGPVVAAAVVLPLQDKELATRLEGVRDSKRMTPSQRSAWSESIYEVSLSVGVGQTTSRELDGMGMIAATRLAMNRALADLEMIPDHLLIDYLVLPSVHIPQTVLKFGDAISLSIAAASVVAKVARDNIMIAMEESHPGYGFAAHKGYGTPQHQMALQAMGPCPQHRRSFSPVAALSFPHHPHADRQN